MPVRLLVLCLLFSVEGDRQVGAARVQHAGADGWPCRAAWLVAFQSGSVGRPHRLERDCCKAAHSDTLLNRGETAPIRTSGRRPNFRLSSRFGGDSLVREGDRDAGAAEVDHRDECVGGVESVGAVGEQPDLAV